jgi:hypothetical protein
VVPVASLLGGASFDIETLYPVAQKIRPPFADGWGPRVNLDGVVSTCGRDELLSYTQVFRDGSLESVMPVQSAQPDVAWIGGFEDALNDGHHTHLVAALAKLGLDGPAFVMLSFVDIGGLALEPAGTAMAAMSGRVATVPEYYRNLLLSELYVESFVTATLGIYGPLFDLAWNAAGRPARPARR